MLNFLYLKNRYNVVCSLWLVVWKLIIFKQKTAGCGLIGNNSSILTFCCGNIAKIYIYKNIHNQWLANMMLFISLAWSYIMDWLKLTISSLISKCSLPLLSSSSCSASVCVIILTLFLATVSMNLLHVCLNQSKLTGRARPHTHSHPSSMWHITHCDHIKSWPVMASFVVV